MDKPIYGGLAAALRYLHGVGVPRWFDYHFVEAAANVAMFIPFGFLARMAWPANAWWHVVGWGLLASTCLELGQSLFLTARFSSLLDVVTNTFGAVVGVAGASLVLRRAHQEAAEVAP
ncbi:membrane hypothetical protein [Arthrobacter sp. 9V]|uniref:VanZ family protein n=1 Tax=Arthrobacter sp. 9V TaxID=2653132 RepID=UPI0012F188B4|nr:VanZ family protein [Arthrobacter sp. 9V]VXC66358.1 membrane hypothetical protein [Arthrobacter sp. 9V]